MLVSWTVAQEITIKPGDSLWALAQRHDTTVEALMQANGLTSASLTLGMKLQLPSGATTQPATYTVQQGDTLYDIAVAFNLSVDELIAFNNLDGALIRVGQVLALVPSATTPQPELLVVTVKPGDNLWALARQYDVTIAAIITHNDLDQGTVLRPGNTLTIPGRYAGSGEGNLHQGGAAAATITVQKGDSLYQLAHQYNTSVAALMSVNNLKDPNLQVGQTLRVIPSSELLPAAPAVVAAPAPQPQPAVRTGPAPAPTMVWPLRGAITSRFGYRQLRINGTNNHTGLDIDGNVGDPIVSATAGVVTFSGWRGGYGNLVIVQSGNTEYFYAHASQVHVSVGEAVTAGQLIANVGTTGAVTGPHLHFEVRVDNSPVDPLPLLEQQAGPP
jgi:murein DD-endopeptidase MepM/ murein hydrolase activator NlpD